MLHKANGQQWQQASEENRLATSADFIAGLQEKLKFELNSMGEFKDRAGELARCITDTTSSNAASSQPVPDIAVLCMALKDWLK